MYQSSCTGVKLELQNSVNCFHFDTCMTQNDVQFGCSTFVMITRWGERPNERVITVGIGWVLLASATSGFSGYIKLAYCSSAKRLQ